MFQNCQIFLSYPEGEYLPTVIPGKNAAGEPTGGVSEANICPKIAKNG